MLHCSSPPPTTTPRDKDRLKRLELIQKNDFEAYQRMLQQRTDAAVGSDERVAEIEKFLQHTEKYLEKMVEKVISSRMQKIGQDAFNAEVDRIKDQGLPQVEILRRAKEVGVAGGGGVVWWWEGARL